MLMRDQAPDLILYNGAITTLHPQLPECSALACKDGRVLMARLFGATPTGGVEVVYKLLSWSEGHFNFTAMPVSVADEIGLRITHLLLEGARRHDESGAPA